MKQQGSLAIVKLPIDSLTPYKRNAKKHPPEQVEQIKESIRLYGNNDPIAVWGKKNMIVEGHGRFLALKRFLLLRMSTTKSLLNSRNRSVVIYIS